MIKKIVGTLIGIDFVVLFTSASLADSDTIVPLIVCACATFLLIPLAVIWTDLND